MKSKILFVVLLLFLFAGCSDKKYNPKFKSGEAVRAKIDGRKGIVIENFSGLYYVRFPTPQIENNGLLTRNSTWKPYVLVLLHEFELEDCNEISIHSN